MEGIVCFALYAFRRGNRRQVEIIAGRSCGALANERSLSSVRGNEKKDGEEERERGGRRAGRKVKILEVAA